MHLYKEQPGDIVIKQQHPNGNLHLYTVLKDSSPANGWSRKKYYPGASLAEEENYSNGSLIEKISYSESGVITAHRIWNNRLKEMVDKPPVSGLPRPNVVTGSASTGYYFKHMPSISEFIHADYQEDSLVQFFNSYGRPGQEEWRLSGDQMSYTIYWEDGEIFFQWHCHCATEKLYWEARKFLHSKEIL